MLFLRSDHIGRPVFATDVSGVKVWTAAYLPFGGVRVSTGTPPTARFPGQWFQSETGLHQNWMRDYDPTTGRYMQADPLGLVDGASVYGYAGQNPGRFIDQNGLEVRIYSSTAFGTPGINHAFVYGTECECGAGTNRSSPSDSGAAQGFGVGDRSGNYNVMSVPPGTNEADLIANIRERLDRSIYLPYFNDCHAQLRSAIESLGYQYPGAPNNRFDLDDNIAAALFGLHQYYTQRR